MSKKIIRLTEGDLHKIIKESVNRILKNSVNTSKYHLNEHTNPYGYENYDSNDMNYENVYDDAMHKIITSYKRGKKYSRVQELINDLYIPNTFNETDYEIVYDACETALMDFDKESVNNILTEMDWKTYMNAAKARDKQGNYKSADKLKNHAQQQFNKKHGLNDYGQMFGKEGYHMQFNLGLNNGTVRGREGNDNKSSYETYLADKNGWAMDRLKGGWEWPSGYSGNSKEYYNQLGKASGDMKRYYGDYGKTPYFKGKGWMD